MSLHLILTICAFLAFFIYSSQLSESVRFCPSSSLIRVFFAELLYAIDADSSLLLSLKCLTSRAMRTRTRRQASTMRSTAHQAMPELGVGVGVGGTTASMEEVQALVWLLTARLIIVVV